MELQHVKEIILRSDKSIQRRASVDDSSSGNNLELDLTGLVESIGKMIILNKVIHTNSRGFRVITESNVFQHLPSTLSIPLVATAKVKKFSSFILLNAEVRTTMNSIINSATESIAQ